VSYRLSRQRFLGMPLDRALVVLAAAAVVYAVGAALLGAGWPIAPALLPLLALWCLASVALRRRGFVVFVAEAPSPPAPLSLRGRGEVDLEPFQQVAVRASGFFEVREERRYFVEASGRYEATALGERIVMVQVQPVSLLGLLGSPEDEWGWWYAFLQPEEVKAVVPGELRFGRGRRPALRLDLAGAPPVYLSFDSPTDRNLVMGDLCHK